MEELSMLTVSYAIFLACPVYVHAAYEASGLHHFMLDSL